MPKIGSDPKLFEKITCIVDILRILEDYSERLFIYRGEVALNTH